MREREGGRENERVGDGKRGRVEDGGEIEGIESVREEI